jgi:hypothetical protein
MALIFYSSLFLSDNMKYEERELLHIILKIRFARHKGSAGNLMTDLPGPEIKESKQRRSAPTRDYMQPASRMAHADCITYSWRFIVCRRVRHEVIKT